MRDLVIKLLVKCLAARPPGPMEQKQLARLGQVFLIVYKKLKRLDPFRVGGQKRKQRVQTLSILPTRDQP